MASCGLLEPRRNANSALPWRVKRRIGRTKTERWCSRSGACAESRVGPLEFSPKLGRRSRSLTSAALLLFPAFSACGEDRLPLSGFRRFSLRLFGKPPCLALFPSLTFGFASCRFGSLPRGQLGRLALLRCS